MAGSLLLVKTRLLRAGTGNGRLPLLRFMTDSKYYTPGNKVPVGYCSAFLHACLIF